MNDHRPHRLPRWFAYTAAFLLTALLFFVVPPLLQGAEAQTDSVDGFSGTGNATTTTVHQGESIQAAIDAASPGDTIRVEPGIYAESLTVDVQGLTLEGTEKDGVVVQASGGSGVLVNTDGVTLRDFDVTGNATNGVVADGANGLRAERVHVGGPMLSAFLFQDGADAVLKDGTCEDILFNCVLAIDTRDLTVDGGVFASLNRGIHVLRGSGANITGMQVSAGGENGLVLEDTAQATVSEALFGNGVFGVWVLRSVDTIIDGVDVGGPSDQGIRIEDSNNTRLVDVDVVHSDSTKPGVGVHVSGGHGTSAVGLAVEGVRQNGITVRDTDGFDARNLRIGTAERGMHVLNTDNLRLDGVKIFNVGENGLVVEDGNGTTSIANVTLSGPSEWGVWVIRTDGARLSHIVVNNYADRGFRIEDSTGVTASAIDIGLGSDVQRGAMGFEVVGSHDVDLSQVAVRKADNVGGVIGQSTGVTLDQGSFRDGGRGLHLIQVQDVTISGSSFNDLKDNGIVVEPGAGVHVLHSQFDGGERDRIGIWFRGLDGQGPGNEVAFNEVSGYRSSGISLDRGAQGVSVHDNEVTGNSKGIKLIAGGGNTGNESIRDNTFENNTITDNTWGFWSEDTRGANTVRGGLLSGNTECDIVLRGDTSLRAEGVGFGDGATVEGRSKLNVTPDPGSSLTDCNSRTVTAKSLQDHECDANEWAFVITQVGRDGVDAPASIFVRWQQGDNREVRLDRVTGSTAHYLTTEHLDQPVEEATANLPDGWSGQFNLSHGPCFGG